MRYVEETTHAEFMVRVHIGRNVNEPSQASICKNCSGQPAEDGETWNISWINGKMK